MHGPASGEYEHSAVSYTAPHETVREPGERDDRPDGRPRHQGGARRPGRARRGPVRIRRRRSGPAPRRATARTRRTTGGAVPPAATPAVPVPGSAWGTSFEVWASRLSGALPGALRRVPFTASVVLVTLVVGLVARTVWIPVWRAGWFTEVAYGVPALREGKLWTLLTGWFFYLTPGQYLTGLVMFAVVVGACEIRLGTRAVAIAAVAGEIGGILLASLLIWALAATSWQWADGLAQVRDVGFTDRHTHRPRRDDRGPALPLASAGSRGTVVLRHRRVGVRGDARRRRARDRRRSRVPRRATAVRRGGGVRAPHPSGDPHARLRRPDRDRPDGTGRCCSSPDAGPSAPWSGQVGPTVDVVVDVVVIAVLANALRLGKRWAWWITVAYGFLNLAIAVPALLLILSGRLPNGAPIALGSALLWLGELGLLLLNGGGVPGAAAPPRPRRGRGDRRATARPGHAPCSCRWGVDDVVDDDVAGDALLLHGRRARLRRATSVTPVSRGARRTRWCRRHDRATPSRSSPAGRAGRLTPCLFSVTDAAADAARSAGWRTVQIAEDTIIDLPGLAFKGKKWQDVRSALNKAKRESIMFRIDELAGEPFAVLAQVRAISEQWVGDKGLPEMGFTLGGVDEALDPAVKVGLAVDATGSIHGVTSWLPVYARGGQVRGWTLDVMRRRDDGFRSVMEFMIASACLAFKEEGARVRLAVRCPAGPQRAVRRRAGPHRPAAGQARRVARALLRLPLAARVQDEVRAALRADPPRLPRRGGPAPHRRRPHPRPTCPTPPRASSSRPGSRRTATGARVEHRLGQGGAERPAELVDDPCGRVHAERVTRPVGHTPPSPCSGAPVHGPVAGARSPHGGARDPQGLPRHAGRARARDHPAGAAGAARRPHDAVHRQRHAAPAALPARGRAPGRGPPR